MNSLLKLETLRRDGPWFQARTIWSPLPAVSVAVLILGIGLFFGWLVSGTIREAYGDTAETELSATASTVMFLLGMQVAMLILTLAAAAWGGPGVSATLSLGEPPQGRQGYLEALLGLVVMVAVFDGIAYAAGFTDFITDLKPFISLLDSPVWPLTVLAVAVGAPLSEELLFRGFLLPALARSRLKFPGAALVTTAAWTALHAGYSPAGIIEVFLVGLYFSWVLWRTGSLRVALFCHAVYNAAIMAGLALFALPA